MDHPILDFKTEVKRMGETVKTLRDRRSVTMFDRSRKTFHRFRINQFEDRLYWMQEASLDRRNWVEQHSYLSLSNVMRKIYNNKVNNGLND